MKKRMVATVALRSFIVPDHGSCLVNDATCQGVPLAPRWCRSLWLGQRASVVLGTDLGLPMGVFFWKRWSTTGPEQRSWLITAAACQEEPLTTRWRRLLWLEQRA